ncbi:hypothetical protein AWB92_23385 [Mycobacterium sp. IEC1808]|nr:hypothetical protein AWB92_23385 [Mycobacterium sp. IEC1808]
MCDVDRIAAVCDFRAVVDERRDELVSACRLPWRRWWWRRPLIYQNDLVAERRAKRITMIVGTR